MRPTQHGGQASCAWICDRVVRETGDRRLRGWVNAVMRRAGLITLLTFASAFAATSSRAQKPEPLAVRVAEALDRARPALLRDLAEAGGNRLGLICLAAIHDGVPADNEVFQAAITRLARTSLHDTYGLSLRLQVMAELPSFPKRAAAAKRDAKRLLACRRDGAFAYASGRGQSDLSNTQYGALGLRAAVALGYKVPKGAWISLIRRVSAWQNRNGSWAYRGRSGSGYGSMTVAGIAVLEICLQHADFSKTSLKRYAKRIDRGWAWMAKPGLLEIGKPTARQCFYFHYGLERAAVLSEKVLVGTRNWYESGAEMLVKAQLASGAWLFANKVANRERGNPISTAFAILFLRRRFQRTTPSTGHRSTPTTPQATRARYLPAKASQAEIQASARLEVRRGYAAVPDLLKLLRGKVAARRRAALLAIQELAKQRFSLDPYRQPKDSSKDLRQIERWWMTEGRKQLK